ncbi:MAG: RNA 2',3'-cyclic phosphodiesterase [Thermodesulfobacteria bacterium]|nr:RNA 2',3'-cyclic phosphodiesterase [Thermodesulfobacteriota bacterium]
MIRAFLAIDLPKDIKKELFNLSKIEIPQGTKLKWVEEQNFHITFRFFGNISEKDVKKIVKEGQKVSQKYSHFKVILDEVGMFKDRKGQPRVVWVGVKFEEEDVFGLYNELEKGFKKLKVIDRKEDFHPHITLFRVKHTDQGFNKYLETLTTQAKSFKGKSFWVKDLTLFKSTLTSKGPIYQVITQIELKKD